LYNYKVTLARDNFFQYRKLINPSIKINWFVQEIADKLQKFVIDLENGLKPMLVIEAPPQHGKSEAISDLISWIAGRNPHLRTIFASFSERLGIRANLKLQRLYSKKAYKDIFPGTKINDKSTVTGVAHLRNREILEYVDKGGYFRNTTVQGSITGESLDLGVVDDPIKGREAANSETTRNKTWDWMTDDFFTRFSENAGFLMILTRWHIDDPAARLIANNPRVVVLKYRAIAEDDEVHRKQGEALIPKHKSLEFLLERKSLMGESFEALFQQNPSIKGGNLFKYDWFKWWKVLPIIKYRIIVVDTAQKTKEQNDFTVLQCWGYSTDGNLYLLDMLRGKFEAPQLRRDSKIFYKRHNEKTGMGALRYMYIEDKSSGSSLIQDFKSEKMKIKAIQRNVDKVSRAYDVIPYIEAGRVYLNEDIPFVDSLVSEATSFPRDKNDDTIDPLMDAISITMDKPVNSLIASMQDN